MRFISPDLSLQVTPLGHPFPRLRLSYRELSRGNTEELEKQEAEAEEEEQGAFRRLPLPPHFLVPTIWGLPSPPTNSRTDKLLLGHIWLKRKKQELGALLIGSAWQAQ